MRNEDAPLFDLRRHLEWALLVFIAPALGWHLGVPKAVMVSIVAITFALTPFALRRRVRVYDWGVIATGFFTERSIRFEGIELTKFRGNSSMFALEAGASFHGRTGGFSVPLFPMGQALLAARYVLDRVVPRLAEAATSRLSGGGAVTWGKVTADRAGLRLGTAALKWREIERASISPEGLRLSPRDRPMSTVVVPLRTPNLLVLVQVATRLREAAPSATPSVAPPAPRITLRDFPADDPRLGALLHGRSSLHRWEIATGLVFFPALAAMLGAIVCHATNAYPVPVELFYACLGVATVSGFGWIFLFKRGRGFAVYEEGIRTISRSIRFDQADHVTYAVTDHYAHGAVYAGRSLALVLEGQGGPVRVQGGGGVLEAVLVAVVDRILPSLIDRRWRQLLSGGEVRIGRLTLTRSAAAWRGRPVPLAQITSYSVQSGELRVFQEGGRKPWFTLPINGVDARLVAPLIDRLRQGP